MNNKTPFSLYIFKILPKALLSRLFGYITLIPFPGFILNPVISWWCRNFGVKTSEFTVPPGGFKNLNAFFTRNLNEGVHVIDPSPDSIVSPVDSRIDEFGVIRDSTLIQAKGIEYPLDELLPSKIADTFRDGTFCTLYLSPGDYHRIHTPCGGKITGFFALPGKLYPVKESVVKYVPGVFSRNERIITYIQTDNGDTVAVCKIGAMNVGKISLAYDSTVSNRTFRRRKEHFFPENKQVSIQKGDELAVFNLGSTIVLLFEKDKVKLDAIQNGDTVRVGQRIASFIRQ